MFKGHGKLLGYRTYKDKNGAQKHIYKVLALGEVDPATGFYANCEILDIVESEQVLRVLKAQEVVFDVTPKSFNGRNYNAGSNIKSAEEGKK